MKKTYTYKYTAGKPQQMDVFFPASHNPATDQAPGMLLFHGGGWRGGDLSQFHAACAHFAARGLVAATANYTMLSTEESAGLACDETRKRVCITDAKSAIRWVKMHAGELGIDPERLISGSGSRNSATPATSYGWPTGSDTRFSTASHGKISPSPRRTGFLCNMVFWRARLRNRRGATVRR